VTTPNLGFLRRPKDNAFSTNYNPHLIYIPPEIFPATQTLSPFPKETPGTTKVWKKTLGDKKGFLEEKRGFGKRGKKGNLLEKKRSQDAQKGCFKKRLMKKSKKVYEKLTILEVKKFGRNFEGGTLETWLKIESEMKGKSPEKFP